MRYIDVVAFPSSWSDPSSLYLLGGSFLFVAWSITMAIKRKKATAVMKPAKKKDLKCIMGGSGIIEPSSVIYVDQLLFDYSRC